MKLQQIQEARDFVRSKLNIAEMRPKVALVLGSGLSHFAEELKERKETLVLPFSEIPNFASSTVIGHKGEIICTVVDDKWPAIIFSGRVHYYEGYEPSQVVLSIRILGLLGIKNLILTNACGAIREEYEPGQLMIIKDHINLTGTSPLIGPNLDEIGPRFVDMSCAYDKEYIQIAKKAAENAGIKSHEGVYAAVTGPCYETPAEVRMLKLLGADAVGMSTVFETIIARHMGMKVLGISCLTNKAAGLSNTEISHQEVMENNAKVASRFAIVLREIISKIA